jgi:hypothetical protein
MQWEERILEMESQVLRQLMGILTSLTDEQRQRVLEYVKSLQVPRSGGFAGRKLVQFAGSISAQDLDLMEQAIRADCERIDPNEW